MTVLLSWDPAGRRCVVVGGGRVGARRAAALAAAGGDVLVVSPHLGEELEQLVDDGAVAVRRSAATAADAAALVAGAALVVVATDDAEVNEAVGAAAIAAGALVNRADRAEAGNVTWTTSVRRGPVTVAVSTDGEAPAVARFVAQQLDAGMDSLLGLDEPQLTDLVAVVGEARRSVRSDGRPPAPVDWRSEQAATILDLIRSGRAAEAKERLLSWQSS